MTDKDKLSKVRAEIERRMRVMKENFATDEASKTKHALTLRLIDHQELLAFIDSMQEEPVSEDLDSFAIKYAQDKPYPVTVCQAVKVGANWQKQKDNNDANHALVEQIKTQQMCYEKGMADMKQQLMANAVDVEVKMDAGGYLYIPQIELYDYVEDIPLAKAGDKYNVVFIKDD